MTSATALEHLLEELARGQRKMTEPRAPHALRAGTGVDDFARTPAYQARFDSRGDLLSFSPYNWHLPPRITIYATDLYFRKKIIKKIEDFLGELEVVEWSEPLY